MHRLLASVLLLAFLLGGGCLPSRFTIDLDPPPERLHERTLVQGQSQMKVVMIPVDGLIADAPLPSLFGYGPNPVDELVRRLDKAANDPSVAAIVLRINSPGGTVTGSETMYREIVRFRETTDKPVVVAMGEIATSGGYYISLAADEIMAMPTTTTGSIGVLFETMNFSEGLEMIGVYSRAITSGPNKDIANPFEPMNEEHYAILQGTVDDMYARFRGLVETRRPDIRDLATATDGRIFTGDRALEMGLIDSLGSVRDAHQRAQELAGVTGASMVTYTNVRVDVTGTPYSAQASSQRTPLATANVSLFGPTIDEFLRHRPGFHYLWTPGVR
jgi:protease-4